MGKPGDPRKREAQRRAGEQAGKPMYWQPFRHDACGCYLEWGMAVPDTRQATGALAHQQMVEFLRTTAPFPCPLHGSATGVPAAPLRGQEARYMFANDVWYRALPEERRLYADRLADAIAGGYEG